HMVLGPLPGEVGLREHLSSHLYLPVEPMDLDAVVQLPPAGAAWAANERANWLKVIGAGLRVEEKALGVSRSTSTARSSASRRSCLPRWHCCRRPAWWCWPWRGSISTCLRRPRGWRLELRTRADNCKTSLSS